MPKYYLTYIRLNTLLKLTSSICFYFVAGGGGKFEITHVAHIRFLLDDAGLDFSSRQSIGLQVDRQ